MGNRKPVPAGGQPTPAAIAAADATPLNGATDTFKTRDGADTPPAGDDDATDERRDDQGDVDARVLVAFGDYAVDDVITDTADAIEQLKLAGRVDPHPDAVAYARSVEA